MILGLLAVGALGFVSGIVIGGLLLCTGLSLGLWCARHTQRQQRLQQLSADRVVELMSGMFQWADTLTDDVSQYRKTLDEIIRRLGDGEDDAEEVAQQGKAISQLVEHIQGANHHLQQRMQTAKTTLKTQASEITQYVCRTRTDDLTGLANRRSFDDILSKHFERKSAADKSVSVLLVEVNRLEPALVQYGQEGVDRILIQTARALREAARRTDVAARYGDTAFAIFMPNSIGAEAVLAAMRIAVIVEETALEFESLPLDVTLSCGVAESQSDDTAQTLMQRAQQALAASRRIDRTCTHLHNGRRCIPLAAPVVSSDENDPAMPRNNAPPKIPAQLQQTCNDLSQRYQEVSQAPVEI